MKVDRHPPEHDGGANRLLVFVHIPRTAGTTLNSILEHQYGPSETYEIMMRGMSLVMPRGTAAPKPLISWSKLRRFRSALKNRQELRLVRGHFDLSLAPLLPASAQYVTLMRDPVRRAVSHFRDYRRRNYDPVHPLAMRSTLAEWVGACGLVEMDNGQTRRLAGELGLPIGRVSSRTLAKAKANLAGKFAVVGLTERFEEALVLLHRHFGWPYYSYLARNAGGDDPERIEADAEALKIVESRNGYDLALYRYAAALFEKAIGKIDMDKELRFLRAAPVYVASAQDGSAHALPGRGRVPTRLKHLFPLDALRNYLARIIRVDMTPK